MNVGHRGGCLCGAVRFAVQGAFESFFLCHCSRCRKGNGSAHGANLFSTQARMVWLEGEESVRTYRVPGSRHQRSFCSRCGSPVPQLQMGGRLLVVPAGALDGDVDLKPTAHICLDSRAGWDDRLDEIPGLPGLP